ncbi:MAG: class I SAM-dependent methyltransferase [Rhodospirillaceae bacterium]|nr:class I SAM-dependent methyltransferase [Rhodospirillaceae bacterium]
MSTFSAEWLRLREPYDHHARGGPGGLRLPPLPDGPGGLSVVDLGSGTGSNLRFLAPRLPGSQAWRLIDVDAELLCEGRRLIGDWGAQQGYGVEGEAEDALAPLRLLRGDTAIAVTFEPCDFAGGVTTRLVGDAGLVTTSALLDLASSNWIGSLVASCRAMRAGLILGLTYDGRIAWQPQDPQDAAVAILINRHQRTPKGMGLAAGPDACRFAADCLRRYGYSVAEAPTDWVLSPEDGALQSALLADWAMAAHAASTHPDDAVDAWRTRRAAYIAAGVSHLTVGHRDLAAWLP